MCGTTAYHCYTEGVYIPTCRTVSIPRIALLQREDSIGEVSCIGSHWDRSVVSDSSAGARDGGKKPKTKHLRWGV